MSKLKYFPFGKEFDIRMGTSVFKESDQLIEVDDKDYLHELSVKRSLLESDPVYYYRSNPGTEQAQWDVLEKVLTNLVQFHPENFILEQNGNDWYWQNKLTNESIQFVFGDTATLPYEPLDWAGRQVQEDLVILSNDGTASLVAGQLCFPNGWCLDDKFNQPFLTIHAPAPGMMQQTIHTAQKLTERLSAEKPVWRCSWNFKLSGQEDFSSKYTEWHNRELRETAPTLTAENIGQRLFIRIERQTLTRLQPSNCILFGIHTYQNKLDDEMMDADEAARMLGVLRTTPRAMLDYKAISPFEEALIKYLEKRIA